MCCCRSTRIPSTWLSFAARYYADDLCTAHGARSVPREESVLHGGAINKSVLPWARACFAMCWAIRKKHAMLVWKSICGVDHTTTVLLPKGFIRTIRTWNTAGTNYGFLLPCIIFRIKYEDWCLDELCDISTKETSPSTRLAIMIQACL